MEREGSAGGNLPQQLAAAVITKEETSVPDQSSGYKGLGQLSITGWYLQVQIQSEQVIVGCAVRSQGPDKMLYEGQTRIRQLGQEELGIASCRER